MPVYHLLTLVEFILKISIQNSYFDQDGMTKEITVLDFRFDKRGTYFEDRLDVISFEVKVRSRDLENSAVLDNLFSVSPSDRYSVSFRRTASWLYFIYYRA